MAWASASASEWPSQAVAVRDRHAAQHQRPAGDQCVRVPAFADAHLHVRSLGAACAACLAPQQQALGKREVGRPGELEVVGLAAHEPRCMAQRLDGAGLVGHAAAGARQRLAQQAQAKHLRRLRRPLAVAIERRGDPVAVASACFKVSAIGRASRPPTASPMQASISRSTQPAAPGNARRRAPAPSPGRRRRAAPAPPVRRRRIAARVAPPQASAQPSNAGAAAAKSRSPGASTTSVLAMRGTRASASRVCATTVLPATWRYCLGTPAAGPLTDAGAGHECITPARCCRSDASGHWRCDSRIRASHAAPCTPHRAGQALHPATPGRFGRCAAACAHGAGAAARQGCIGASSLPTPPTRSAWPTSCRSSRRACALPCSRTGRRCPTTPSRRTRT